MPKRSDKSKAENNTEIHIESTVEAHVSAGADDQLVELEADLKRVQADFLNYKRRTDADRGEMITMAKQVVITELLPVLDNISRALTHLPEDLADNDWAKGVAQVGKQAEDTLRNLGVERIETVGQPFDPNLHEAISMEDGEGETEIVTEELQSGYRIGDRVIRHAMVKVARQ
jgi:molecular chaperone GrpE